MSRATGFPDGILLVDKAAGETSFDVVRKVRQVTGVRKVGHAGTLDPFSTGLVVLMLGKGTKLSAFLMSGKKRYRAVFRLGIETDTYDPEGQVVGEKPVPNMTPEFLGERFRSFVGEIEQIPPAFSAVHVDGKRAYKLARRGLDVQLDCRKVIVDEFRLLSMDLPDVTVEVVCSSGTYLRSLAFDLGRMLETGAHVHSLRRLSSGAYRVDEAVDSKHFRRSSGTAWLRERVIPLAQALPDAKEIRISGALAERIRNGYTPRWEEILPGGAQHTRTGGGLVRLLCDGELIAVMETAAGLQDGKTRTKHMRVFH